MHAEGGNSLSFPLSPPGWRCNFCPALSISRSLLRPHRPGRWLRACGVRNSSVFTQTSPAHTWLPLQVCPPAVRDAGLDQRGQWGRARAGTGPCPSLPVSPLRPFLLLLLLARAADLAACRVRSPGSLSPVKSVFPKCL